MQFPSWAADYQMNLIQLYFKRDYMSRDAEMCAQHSEYGHSVCVSETSKLKVSMLRTIDSVMLLKKELFSK